MVPKKSTPGKFAYNRHFQQTGINARKFERMLIHFKSDVYAAVAVVDAKTLSHLSSCRDTLWLPPNRCTIMLECRIIKRAELTIPSFIPVAGWVWYCKPMCNSFLLQIVREFSRKILTTIVHLQSSYRVQTLMQTLALNSLNLSNTVDLYCLS